MITTDNYFDNYSFAIKTKLKKLIDLEKDLKNSKLHLFSILDKNKQVIDTCSNINYKDIFSMTLEQIQKIEFDFDKLIGCDLNSEDFKKFLSDYTTVKNKLVICKNEIKTLEDLLITRDEYKFVVRGVNKGVVKQIVEEGYKLNLFGFGSIYIKRKQRKPSQKTVNDVGKFPINWGASNRKKALLIKNNIIPYNKDTAPDGAEWFIYHTDPFEVWWWWSRISANFAFKLLYSFVPTKHSTGNIKYLHQYKKVNPDVIHKYATT